MLILLITAILVVALVVIAVKYVWNETICAVFGRIICALGLIVVLLVPVAGYEEPILEKEIELTSFSNGTSGCQNENIYLMVSRGESADDLVYREIAKSEYNANNEKNIKVISTMSENVKIHQDASCKKPVLKIYEQKAKGKWWLTFAADTTKTIYEFYLPENSVME